MEENKKTSMERLTEASEAFKERMKKDLDESERFKLMERYSNFLSQLEVNGEEENKILTNGILHWSERLLNLSTIGTG